MMSFRVLRTSSTVVVLGAISLALILQANQCPGLDQAKDTVRTEIKKILAESGNQGRNWRVHWKRLDKGTEVSSFDGPAAGDVETYRCRGWCVLFFLDLNPFAHFAHPTRILVYDSNPLNREFPITVLKSTEWWPTIREEGWEHPASVFNTVAEREDPQQVFHLGDVPRELPLPVRTYDLVAEARYWPTSAESDDEEPIKPSPTPAPVQTPTPAGDTVADTLTCNTSAVPVWAILVNGYNDVSNTFDEDVGGMYAVLRGFDVLDGRIRFLSPLQPPGLQNWMSASKEALGDAFSEIKEQMEVCKNGLGSAVPHFLLFWSSHGTDKILFCNRADGNQDNVNSDELHLLLDSLETIWKPDDGVTKLAVTIVIEACKSGSVAEELHAKGQHRRILASARGDGAVSYRDIDYDIDGTSDPNPADAGSETIWGYVEAFGTASADTNPDGPDGKISFDEAVEYARMTDITFQSGDHDIGVWTPVPVSPSHVHGAWNTSERVASSVAFTAPASTNEVLAGSPVTAKVVAGEPIGIDIEIDNPDALKEKGALALRLFRNDCPESATDLDCDEWEPRYYSDGDNLRTTVMIPGLAASESVLLDFPPFELPSTYGEGDTMRLVVTLDSAQKMPATGGTIVAMPSSEIILEVEKKCTSICCWWKSLWN